MRNEAAVGQEEADVRIESTGVWPDIYTAGHAIDALPLVRYLQLDDPT